MSALDREGMTAAQQRVYDFVRTFWISRGFPPTRSEIAAGLGFKSATAAECHLVALEAKGRVRIHRGIARGLELIAEPAAATPAPGCDA